MPILQQLQNHFPAYVWKHVLSILAGLMLLKEAKTLTALKHHESLPTLSRTLNVYEWPLDELRAVRRSLITQALKRLRQKRGRPPFLYLILDDTVVPKRGKRLPELVFHFSSSEERVVHGWEGRAAALDRGAAKRGLELDLAGRGGERVARYSGASRLSPLSPSPS